MDGPKTGRPVTLEVQTAGGECACFDGLVVAADPEGFGFALTPGPSPVARLSAGGKALVRYADSRGLHAFEAPVVAVEPGERTVLRVGPAVDVSTQQRRRFMRLAMQLSVSIAAPGAAAPLAARTVDLGGNGASVVCAEPLAVGAKVGFELDLQRWGRCTGSAQVKRSVLALSPAGAEYRSALQFTELPARSQALLLTFLAAARKG